MSREFKKPLLTKADMDREWTIPASKQSQETPEQKTSEQPISNQNTIEVTFFRRSSGTSTPSDENP